MYVVTHCSMGYESTAVNCGVYCEGLKIDCDTGDRTGCHDNCSDVVQ